MFVDSLVLMLEGGGRSLEDLRELSREEALMSLVERNQIPDPDTRGDWLRRMGDPQRDQAGLKGVGRVRDEIHRRILRRDGTGDYTLDVDATQVLGEKREASFTYQGEKGYMPMLGFLFEAKGCLMDEFREGNVPPGAGHREFYRQSKERVLEGKRIGFYRADSASYQAELIHDLEGDGVFWAITADQDAAVKRLIASIGPQGWQEPTPGCGYEIVEAVHTRNKTRSAFRLIIKREVRRQGDLFEKAGDKYFHHVVASNWPGEEKSAHEVLVWHNQRGQAENFNKELLSGWGMERMPCGESWANAVFFRIGVIAYNLFIGCKRLSCPEAWAHHTIATLRWRMVQVAGRIIPHAGQVFLSLVADVKTLELFHQIRCRCFDLSGVPDG